MCGCSLSVSRVNEANNMPSPPPPGRNGHVAAPISPPGPPGTGIVCRLAAVPFAVLQSVTAGRQMERSVVRAATVHDAPCPEGRRSDRRRAAAGQVVSSPEGRGGGRAAQFRKCFVVIVIYTFITQLMHVGLSRAGG